MAAKYGNRCCLIVTDCQALHKGNDLVVYGQFAKDECFINNITTKIKLCSEQMDNVRYANVGSRCLAKFTEDGCWYRAVVMDKLQGSCVVKFMDYGHTQVTLLSDLKSMPRDLTAVEPLCHEFILDVEGNPVNGQWTNEVAERLKNKYAYHEISIELHKLPSGCFVAKSFDIRNTLIDWGFMDDGSVKHLGECFIAAPQFSVHQKLHVSIDDVLPDGSFYCHAFTMESELSHLLNELYESCTGPDAKPLTRACKGQHCCAKFSDGNWYRAQIVDIDGSDAVVHFVDYGDNERCELSSLVSLDSKFASLPAQGIHCMLSADRRPEEKLKILSGLIEKPVTIEFVNTDLKPYPVRLHYRGALVGLTATGNGSNEFNPVIKQKEQLHSREEKIELESERRKSNHSFEVPLNCETPIRITYVESPSNIWIQLIDNQAMLIRLTSTLNAVHNAPQHIVQMTNLKAGQYCCVKSQRTHHWCRGKISFVCKNSVEVKFMDFGHTEVTHFANIRPLQDELTQFPPFAICCKLNNAIPESGKWCSAGIKYLNGFVAKSGITAKFVSKDDDVYVAEIFVLAQCGRITLNNDMVEKGYACSGTLADSRPMISNSSVFPSSKRYYPHAGVGLVGAQVLVSICADPTPGEFWVLPCNALLQQTFNQLTKEMKCYVDSVIRPFVELYPGMPCVYVNGNEVLRAAIVSFEHPNSPEIFFVDLGRKRRVPITSVRPIADEHIYFAHPLAIRCTMCGIIEPKSKYWSTAAIHTFSKFCSENNRNILCTVHACITDGTSEMIMVKVSSPFKDIADILVEMGNCQYVCPFGKLSPPYSLKSYVYNSFTGIGKEETFYVTHTIRADLFYCQLTDNFEVMDDFMDKLQRYCNSHESSRVTVQELVRAPLCFVKYDDDRWYRAHFISLAPVVKLNYAVVFLVDYGNMVNVLLQNILAFDQKSSLAEVPMQALPCCLSEIVSRIHDDTLSDRVLSKQKSLILHKVFPGLVTGSTNGKLHIDLYTDALQKKRINSAFAEDINPSAALPPISSTVADDDTLLKGQYKDISSSVEAKSCHTVTVTFVNDPCDFYVRFHSCEEMFQSCYNDVDGRYTAMRCQDYCVTSLDKGDIVCAKEPSTLRWCRGIVIDVESCEEENKVLVEFVDIGCKEMVSVVDSVKKLSSDLSQWPKLAIHCRLNNLRPIGEDWTDSNRHQFATYCQSSQCRLRFNTYDEAENIWSVDMKVEGKSVARTMVEKKEAVYVVPPARYAIVAEHVKTEKEVVKTVKKDYFKAGEVEKVYISHVESTATIFLQLVHMEDALEKMMDKINQPTATCIPIANPDRACSYLSRYDEDGMLYRVNILAIRDEGKLDIIYSDYGNSASVDASQLFILPKDFSELPEQAIECVVSYPPEIDLPVVVTKLKDLATDEGPITARCLKSSPLPIEVELDICKSDGTTIKFVDLFQQNFEKSSISSPDIKYKPCGVETEIKSKVFLSQVDSPSQVWIQLSSATTCLETLMTQIEEFCADNKATEKPKSLAPGMPCLAKYTTDGGWYRGKIVKLFEFEAVVLFIDYGNQDNVKIDDILTIDEKFLAVPQQAIKCRLHNVRNMDAWTSSDISKFVDRVSDVELIAYFHHCNKNPGIYDVDLIYPCGKSLNEEWNETLPSCSEIIDTTELSNNSDETEISTAKPIVMDRGDHVIVDNVNAAPASKLDFNSLPVGEISLSSTSMVNDISINIGCVEDGYISHCEELSLFYIQLSKFSLKLDEISEEITAVCVEKSSQSIPIDIGELCIAKCPDIGEWYRGKCVAKEDDLYSVYFIDYGNTSLVSSADVMAITSKLSAFPHLAIPCKLDNLQLMADSWSKATESFLDLSLDQELKIEFMEHRDGIWSVKLTLSEEDIGECLIKRHGDIVANRSMLKSALAFNIKPGSMLCIKVINVDVTEKRFDAVQLSTPKGTLEQIVNVWLHDNGGDTAKLSNSVEEVAVSSYFLVRLQEKWTCIKILDVTGEIAHAIDLLEHQLIEIDIHSEIIQCPSDLACVVENVLLSCILPSNQSIDNLIGSVVAAEFRSRDNCGNWTLDILSTCPHEETAHETVAMNGVDDQIVNDIAEQLELKEWIAKCLPDLTRFFEVGDVIFKDCPDRIKHSYESLLEVKNVILRTQNTVQVENSLESLKRLSCDSLGKHQEYPAKKRKFEACIEDWSNAVISKFSVGDTFEAVISSIVDPWKIFVRPYLLISESTSYDHGNLEDREKDIVQSKCCLVQVTDRLSSIDHWIRGKFIEKMDDSFAFIDMDSGLNVKGTMENIIPVGESLLAWPLFCMECSLAGIKPIHGAASWGTTPTNELNSIVNSLNVADKVEVTILAITTSEESVQKIFAVNLNVNKQSISNRLITMEIACPVDYDKENFGKELATTSDDFKRTSHRKPFKELEPCNTTFHSPLPITPRSVGQDFPIMDLLAVPWKFVRLSREGSNSERLSDSVFVSEAEESVHWDPSIHCGRRPMTSFKIYCSNLESVSDKNIVNNCLSCLPEMPEGRVNENDQSADTLQPSQLVIPKSLNKADDNAGTVMINGAIIHDQQRIASVEEDKVSELAWEVVEKVLYNLSLELNQIPVFGDESNHLQERIEQQSACLTENLETGNRCSRENDGKHSDGSHTMIVEDHSENSSGTLPISQVDTTILGEYAIGGDTSSLQQVDEELEEAVERFNLNENDNTILVTSVNNAVDCEELEGAVNNLVLKDPGSDIHTEGSLPHRQTVDGVSTSTSNMQLMQEFKANGERDAITGCNKVETNSKFADSNARECCDYHIVKHLSGNTGAVMHGESAAYPLLHVGTGLEGCTDSKNSEQYFSAESCFATTNLDCNDNKAFHVGGTRYNSGSTITMELAMVAAAHIKGSSDACDASQGSMSNSHAHTYSDDVQENYNGACINIQVDNIQSDLPSCRAIDSHVKCSAVPEVNITQADTSCSVKGSDQLDKGMGITLQEATIHSGSNNVDEDICITSHRNQSIGICCLPPLQIDIGDVCSVSFIKIGTDPLAVTLQFDAGPDSNEWQKAMIRANGLDSIAKLKPCEYFESDMMCLVASPDSSMERGRILHLSGDVYSVELIDHGETVEVKQTELHKLPEELCIYPRQSMECLLHGIKIDLDEAKATDKWKTVVCPYLDSLLRGRALKAEVVDIGTNTTKDVFVKLSFQEENGRVVNVSELLVKTELAMVAGQDEMEDDGQWTTINDSSYDELVKGSDSSVVLHSSNADLSIIEEAFEEDLPEIPQQERFEVNLQTTEKNLAGVAKSIYTRALAGAIVVARFGSSDVIG